MNEQAQRICIAEACGYYTDTEKSDESLWWLCSRENRDGIGRPKADKRLCWQYAPDYPNDLNAMHEAFVKLRADGIHQAAAFYCELKDIVYRDMPHQSVGMSDICNATAAQRAEAFLKTIGKWVESEQLLTERQRM